MSVSTRKQSVSSSNGLRDRVVQASRPVGSLAGKTMPIAQQAMPLARNAGTTVRQGAEMAIARVTPAVDAARSWAAPQLEHSAQALTDTIAPVVSEALLTAAHKIDVPRPRRRVRAGLVAGTLALTAAAGAATFAAIRMRRQDSNGVAADGEGEPGRPEEPGPDADADGHSRIV